MTLQDSSDSHPTDAEARLLTELQSLYALKSGGGILMVLAGAGIILLAGVAVVSVITFVLYTWIGDSWLGWTGWYIVYLLAIVPILVREERRSRGSFFADAAAGFDVPANASSYGEYQLDRGMIATSVYAEMLLWGPRALLGGIRLMRGQPATRLVGMMQRASQIILTLYRDANAMELKKLIQPGEPPAQFRETLKWLDNNDYIGLSTDGKRVWLSSRMRQRMSTEGY